MTEQEYRDKADKQYQDLREKLNLVLQNQAIQDRKLDQIQRYVDVAIGNTQILGRDQDELIKLVKALG